MLRPIVVLVLQFIENYFFAGYSLEEIAVYSNTNVKALISYISDEDIEIMGKRKIKNGIMKDKHPLIKSFK